MMMIERAVTNRMLPGMKTSGCHVDSWKREWTVLVKQAYKNLGSLGARALCKLITEYDQH